ncbi:hypothetical protein K7432_010400 [Basidiobolus ranarum]
MATSCGSPCYAAPELVVSEGMYVGTAVDIWSCGVILYAMLCGYLPFDDDPENPDGDNINLLYKYILSTPLVFPDYVSPDGRDLLRRMLVPDPTQRCDMRAIMSHNWLAPYAYIFEESKNEWEDMEQSNMESDSPTYTETARPPKRHTIQVEYDQSPVANLSSPELPESHLNGIVEADEEDGNDPMAVEVTLEKPLEQIHLDPFNSTRHINSHNRVRPTTIHFSQPTHQQPADLPSIIIPREHSRGQFVESIENSNMQMFESPISSNSQTPCLPNILHNPTEQGNLSVLSDPLVVSDLPSSVQQQSMSSNAAKKVMDWFRKKSLGKHQHTFESHMSHPRRNHCRVSHEFRLRCHTGAIDDNAVTSKSPIELMQEIKMLLEELGIEIKKEYEWKLKCVRKKKACTNSLKSRNSVISTETQTTATPSIGSSTNSSRRRTSAFTRLLKIGSQEVSCPVHFDGLTPMEPIYGDETVDSGEEINFVMEICKLKELGKLYIVDITRRKGNLWSYKFIYHTILDRLNLKNDRFMESFNTEQSPFPNTNANANHHVIL